MKRKMLVLVAFVLLAFALVPPIHSALARGSNNALPPPQVEAARPLGGHSTANTAKVLVQSKSSQSAALQAAPADCANDTADGTEVAGATDTDNVDLQCGDQTTSDPAGVVSVTGEAVKPAIGTLVNAATGAKAKSATGTKVKAAESTGDPDNVDQQVEETGGPQDSTGDTAGQ